MTSSTTGKFTKIYLKNCRGTKEGCIHQFFTTRPNKLYCSAKCQHEAKLTSWRNTRRKQYRKNKKRENLKPLGTIKQRKLATTVTSKGSSIGFIYKTYVISYLGFSHTIVYETKFKYNLFFYSESLRLKSEKNETFRTGNSKGKQKDPNMGSSPSHQYVTEDDLYYISTSYLKENNLKCPECGNKQNLVERALLICSNPKCGLVLGAPVLHPGFVLYDLTPIKKIAPTVQDFTIDFTEKNKKSRKAKSVEVVKEAHDSAYQKYKKETGSMFEEVKEYSKNDPLNPIYWMKRKKYQQN